MGRGAGVSTTPILVRARTSTLESALFLKARVPDPKGPQGIVWARTEDDTQVPEQLSYPANSLLVLAGLPGAGKTTLLKRLAPDAVIINPEIVAAKKGLPVATPQATKALLLEVRRALKNKKSVILDLPALYPHLRDEYMVTGHTLGAGTHMLVMGASPEEARDGQRRRRDQKKMIPAAGFKRYKKLYQEFLDNLQAGDSGKYDSVHVVDRKSSDSLKKIIFS